MSAGHSKRFRGTCFVHIGTHKTGSTTLQNFLRRNAAHLAVSGIHVPVSGRLADSPEGSGHHCVAWDLLGSDPGSSLSGTIEQLIAEIQTRSLSTVCLSSEEFVHLYLFPNKLQRLHAGLAGIGYRTVLVMYLRPQADYLEALYAEVSRHAPVRDFWAVYREMLKHGALDFWPESRFTTMFDYERLIAPFLTIVGKRNVVIRPFRRDDVEHQLVEDFMRTVTKRPCLTDPVLGAQIERRNPGLNFGDVLRNIERNRSDLGRAKAEVNGDFLEGPFDPLRLNELLRLIARFGLSNIRLLLSHRVAVGCVSRRRLARAVQAQLGGSNARRKRLAALKAAFRSPSDIF